ncbi:MAG: ImmA/IrrE family metallo-endopeptidase [Candidatus Omnitrophota bacterium]|jgi:Zn-dependent peptidase ImmA (M78 family)/transcriptional regulator with XRE-family HTH domain|nr:MAG: ImmA/IrrE family metallo-endopeptidase [Candidatus Omnitrophota bacterium]
MAGNNLRTVDVGEQIKHLRTAVRIQINQLANIVGISRNTITNYESGKTEPTTGDLYKIANALGCRITDFFAEGLSEQALQFAFRAHKAITKNPLLMVAARKYFHAYTEIEEITGTKLISKFRPFTFDPEEMPLEQWIQTAADKTRESCDIADSGPENILNVLENLGIRSLFFQTDADGLDGLSARQGDMSLIMLRERDRIIERTIFSAAHELGHLVLHPKLYTASTEEEENERDYEKEADLFAGNFLVPTDDLMEIWNNERLYNLPLVHALISLKEVFRVSFWCLYNRVSQNHLTKIEYPQLITKVKKILKIRGKAKMEDLEPNPLPVDLLQKSTRFMRLVRSAFLQEKIGVAKVAELLQITVNQAKEITAKWMAPQSELVG